MGIARQLRTTAAVAVVALVATTAAAAPAAARADARQDQHTTRAVEAYQSMQRYFGVDNGLYLETYPREDGSNPYAYVWPYSQAMIGALTMVGLPSGGSSYRRDLTDRLRALELYWNSGTTPPGYDSYVRPPLGHGGDKFYDDNEWIGLALLQHHKRTGDRAALARAAEIFDLVVAGWDDDPSHPCPGGVYWTQAPWSQDRNTVSNGPGAELGLHLYLLTRRPEYLRWAQRMYDWTNGCLLAPNGLYWDHIDLAGTVEKTQWSYNQGVMLGAATLLYRITGEARYLRHAIAVASTAIAYYNEGDRWFTQPARFNAIFFKNLLILSTVHDDPAYRATIQRYADKAWQQFRDPTTGLYRFEGAAPVTLLEQAAMVQIHALLAWSPRDYRLLA